MARNALLDFLQAASNEAAGAVSAPVDLLSWGLRKAGLPVPENALLSTYWMAQRGLTRPVQPGAAQVAGATAGLLSPTVLAAKAPQVAAGLLQAGRNWEAPSMQGAMGQRGAIVYHGSPHKFDAFDSSKMGTGEGNQQQGVGSYLGEAMQVGQRYADRAERLTGAGYLYKVDAPDEMLQRMAFHDRPFSAQPPHVQEAVTKAADAETMQALKQYHGWESINDAPFSAILDALEIAKGNNRQAATDALRALGVPGLKYLDRGSRSAGGGTHNLVVFPGEENALRILERNGQKIGKP